jgi:hypothetical protein
LIDGACTQEREFLEKADEELEKVNRFYASQESELLARGEALTEQLRILADVKRILADHSARRGRSRLGRYATMPPPPSHSPSLNGSSGRHLLSSGLSSPQSMSGRCIHPRHASPKAIVEHMNPTPAVPPGFLPCCMHGLLLADVDRADDSQTGPWRCSSCGWRRARRWPTR